MRQCVPGCAHTCAPGCLMCRVHWATVSPEKKRALYPEWLRWQRGEITERKYARLAIDSLNTANILEARRAGAG